MSDKQDPADNRTRRNPQWLTEGVQGVGVYGKDPPGGLGKIILPQGGSGTAKPKSWVPSKGQDEPPKK